MRYTTRQYAEALLESLEGKADKDREVILARFMSVLRRSGDARRLNEILVRYEEVFLKARGMVKVTLESASALPAAVKKEIEKALGKPIELIETIEPKLLAGLRILLDDRILIDASALRRLESFRK
jgi:F0F1-type ATP synthase delta subunit